MRNPDSKEGFARLGPWRPPSSGHVWAGDLEKKVKALSEPREMSANPISEGSVTRQMTPRDKELLEGMCNCYAVCGEDFEGTVAMVAGSRGRATGDVKETLQRIARENGNEREYRELRDRLPAGFPF